MWFIEGEEERREVERVPMLDEIVKEHVLKRLPSCDKDFFGAASDRLYWSLSLLSQIMQTELNKK